MVKTCNDSAKNITFVFLMNLKLNWDGVGIATSVACAIHCAILPLMLTSLPLFGVNIIHNGIFEWSMIALAFLVGTYSLYHGYSRHHRSVIPFIIFAGGFILLVAKQFYHEYQLAFLIPAVILIVSAHLLNLRYCNRSKCSSAHHQH
jgi:hypothetical protein